jgi:hypothetical protein
MSTAHPRGIYIAEDPAGWAYMGTRAELDARIRLYRNDHPGATNADAERAIRTADRHRAAEFLYRVKRNELAALIGGPNGREPTRAFDADTEETPRRVPAPYADRHAWKIRAARANLARQEKRQEQENTD